MSDKIDSYKKSQMKTEFLKEMKKFEVGGNATIACKRLGYTRSTLYLWRSEDATFERSWNDTVLQSKIQLKEEAEYALRKGILRGNPALIIFALKNLAPEEWKDRGYFGNNVKKFENYGEYRQFCEQNNIDPDTGLRIATAIGSPQVEEDKQVQE